AIAAARESTPARVALSWLRSKAGVSSIIIGARRIDQLEDNVRALDLTLSADEIRRLDDLTAPRFDFPQNMEPSFPAVHNGGTCINGVFAEPAPFGIGRGDKPH